MILIKDCKDGYLYFIVARNSFLGIYDSNQHGFIISRIKGTVVYSIDERKLISNNFLFTEYHWDIGDINPDMKMFGTAKPIEEICKAPLMNDEKKLQYLNEMLKLYKDKYNLVWEDRLIRGV